MLVCKEIDKFCGAVPLLCDKVQFGTERDDTRLGLDLNSGIGVIENMNFMLWRDCPDTHIARYFI
ncbi:MAG: hypothetical protein A3G34_06590 [Candidatus Lindowbacteria bacterium RIFCSPLOWO2_12_FULL_62_27]|nr:MAG: hypothetical protein A3G34_06590 [Candidatus Lindowbacteria bacterium RIFCSPLOWO2_12_FULL_62_27]OGH63052.1 MAG: hypothetical protein A3I06_16495 [Candidatus Lindowbacteria bacterium RIFCSPLOWO2_02_FULL_62_12]